MIIFYKLRSSNSIFDGASLHSQVALTHRHNGTSEELDLKCWC